MKAAIEAASISDGTDARSRRIVFVATFDRSAICRLCEQVARE
jgi:hypothetical protein